MTGLPLHRGRAGTVGWLAPIMLIAGALAYVGLFIRLTATGAGYDTMAGLVVAPAVFALALPFVLRLSRREADLRIRRVIVASFGLKMVASMVRYAVAFEVYDGVADAAGYHGAGAAIARSFWSGAFAVDVGSDLIGTGFVRLLTGIVYTVITPTKLGGFLVFAVMGWFGIYLFFRAFRQAIPDGHAFRYALVVFLLPSLLYWPSSIGKESWMMLVLGIAAFGAARIFTGRYGGLVALVIGLVGTTLVRPHMALLIITSLAVAAVVTTGRAGLIGRRGEKPTGRLLVALIVVVGGGFVARQVQDFFAIDELGRDTVDQVLASVESQTETGGSQFEARRVSSPVDVPAAVVSVLFRPFPWEARNAQALFASAEGVLLIYLLWRWRRDLMAVPRQVRRNPYVAFVATYSVLFILAFSSFGNFGLLARERTQVFPFVLVLIAVAARDAGREHGGAPPVETVTSKRAEPSRSQ